MRRWQILLGFATLAGLGLTGCGGGGDSSGTTLIFARGSDAEKLDPADVDDGESVNTLQQVCEGLVRFKPGTLEIEPLLAESYQVSGDGLAYTFQIREGITFHDGTPLDAEAAAFSFRRQLDPEHPAHFPEVSFSYWNYLYQDVESVEVTGPMTLVIRLSQPNASMLASLATFPVWLISPRSLEEYGLGLQRHPVGTGPWVFEQWREDEAVIFTRNENYWREGTGYERLVIRSIPNNTGRLTALRSGNIDGMDGIEPAEVSSLEKDERFTVYRQPGLNVGYAAISAFSEPLNDPEVRQAIAHAINREELVRLAYSGIGTVADFPLPPGMLGYPGEDRRPYPFDPDRARALLAAHPEAMARPIVLATTSDPRPYFPDPVKIASILKNDLEAVGFTVNIVTRDWKSHLNVVRRGDFDLGLLGWNGDNGDPDNFLSVFFGSWAAEMGAATNISFYKNPEMDEALLAARAEVDTTRRQTLYEEVLTIWERDLPLIPLVHSEQVVVFRSEVESFQLWRNTNIYLGTAQPADRK